LRKAVGVRAESTFYADANDDGLWDHFVSGGHQITYDSSTDGSPGWDQQILGGITDYPTKDSCPFLNAVRTWPTSLWSVPAASAFTGYHPDSSEQPDYYESPLKYIMHPSDLDAAGWNAYFNTSGGLPAGPYRALYSYELRASCRGTNMGAALRTGYNALTDPDTRRDTGSVWVMVLLSDGAAGASDPATRGGADLQRANPYLDPAEAGYLNNPTRGDYGAYGVCPFGTPDNPGELVDYESDKPHFPYCGDETPETRHFCFDPNLLYTAADGSVNISIELSNARFPNCQLEYDVDDYARDWADFIGLEEPFPWATIDADNTLAQNVAGKRTGTQLPTIFSIGFGLKFPNGGHTCGENVEDCLGEELLRYIADVGDNQQIDTDYQQDLRYDGEGDFDIGAGNSFGARGPCEGPVVGYPDADTAKANGAPLSSIINSLTTRQSCGNYYNAPSGHELEVVFNDIASRMFTQLAR
ncbi:MAG: hypothetical protein K8I60_10115, partial [Anaerolineae bacterium]|nr:hypothetical protein [Anaerolineae bacterium]